MSDKGRQSLTDKAAATLKPDSEKSTFEQVGDTVKGKLDTLVSKVQPEGQKSMGQKVADIPSSGHEGGTSLVDKTKGVAEDIENRITD